MSLTIKKTLCRALPRAAGLLLGVCLSVSFPTLAADQRWQSVDSIRQAAQAAAGVAGARAHLDDRIRMLACQSPLQARPRAAGQRATSRTVQVQCARPAWTLYVPVRADARQSVVVLDRSMGRGEVVTPADLRLERRPQSAGYAYITSVDAVAGKRLTRPAAQGTALTPAWVDAPLAVSRGQEVTVLAAAGGLKIRTRGEALSEGSLNDRIRVRNLSSGRVIEAVIRSAETVEVIL